MAHEGSGFHQFFSVWCRSLEVGTRGNSFCLHNAYETVELG